MLVRHTPTRAATRAGFTLMEVMVVVVIIVILASVGSVAVFRYLDDAKQGSAKMAISNIDTAVKSYCIQQGDYPEDLTILTQPLEGKPAYLEADQLIDPWKRPYVYERESRHPSTGRPLIYSNGANVGDPNGRITNWNTPVQ